MINFKKINTKNCLNYFFNDLINIKNFDPSFSWNRKISVKSGTDFFICITNLNISQWKVFAM